MVRTTSATESTMLAPSSAVPGWTAEYAVPLGGPGHLLLATFEQAAIGIATLLMQVPLHWGLLHQAGALVVFGFAVANWRGFYGEYPHGTMIAERD